MKRTILLFSFLLFILTACSAKQTAAPATVQTATFTVTVTPAKQISQTSNPTPTVSPTATEEPIIYLSYTVKDFSDAYYGIIKAEDTEELTKRGQITIFDKQTGDELIQVNIERFFFEPNDEEIETNILEFPYGEQSYIMYDDFNFDGNKDFAIRDGDVSCYGSPSYQVFLYQDGFFSYNESFTDLAHHYCGMFITDTDNQKLYTMTKSGCCWHQYSDFEVQNNEPVPVQIIEIEWEFPFQTNTVEMWQDDIYTKTEDIFFVQDRVDENIFMSFDIPETHQRLILYVLRETYLNFAVISDDEHLLYAYPIRIDNKQPAIFTYTKKDSEITLQFTDQAISYKINQLLDKDEIEKITIERSENGETSTFDGDVQSIKGNLLELESVVWENVNTCP